jgi:hypothetical protein
MAVAGGRRDQAAAVADAYQPSKRERLGMVPVHFTGVDLANELVER